jgi:ketosteroid isomerase-like protein
MSEENVEVVRRLNAAFRGTDPHPPSDFLAPDAVWDVTTFEGWPEQGEYRGPDEYAAFIAAWVAPYDDWAYEVEELIDAGDEWVVARLYQRGRPRGGAGWIEMRYGIVYTVEHGLVRRAQVYATVDEALKAAGLSQ